MSCPQALGCPGAEGLRNKCVFVCFYGPLPCSGARAPLKEEQPVNRCCNEGLCLPRCCISSCTIRKGICPGTGSRSTVENEEGITSLLLFPGCKRGRLAPGALTFPQLPRSSSCTWGGMGQHRDVLRMQHLDEQCQGSGDVSHPRARKGQES